MKIFLTISLTLVLALSLAAPAARAGIDPYELLKTSDQARGNRDGISWTVTITATERGKTNLRQLKVRSRGFDAVAETLKPARRRGQLLITLKGNMWFYRPGLSKPVPISKRQKLLGLATNGDIASTNYAENYEILNSNRALTDNEECIVFDLKAKVTNAAYRRVKYWVSLHRQVGIKTEFYSTNGKKLLKSATMEYDNKITDKAAGQHLFISRIAIKDELMSKGKTVMEFSPPDLQPYSPDLFNINLLGK